MSMEKVIDQMLTVGGSLDALERSLRAGSPPALTPDVMAGVRVVGAEVQRLGVAQFLHPPTSHELARLQLDLMTDLHRQIAVVGALIESAAA
jgi:hypothetical protein